MRVGVGGAFALDFGTVMQMGQAVGADLSLLAEVLPAVESAIITRLAAVQGEE